MGEFIFENSVENLFVIELWNYTNMPFHVGKYAGLVTSLGLGIGAFFLFKLIYKPILKIITNKISYKVAFIIVFTIYYITLYFILYIWFVLMKLIFGDQFV